MKILIADDHRLIVEDLKSMIAEIMPEAEITGSSEPSEILPLCRKNGFHVIFLDIELDDLNGIKLAEKILNEFPRTNIIYITGYEKYALESYRTHASGFLLKPIDPCMLEDALNNLRFPVSSITENMLVSQSLSGAVIGMKIKKCREERGMSRNDFAEELGCVLSTVGRWENGTRLPDVAIMKPPPRPAPRTATANTGSAPSAANASATQTAKMKSPKPPLLFPPITLSPRSTRKPKPAPRTATANTGSATSAANASATQTEKPKSPKPPLLFPLIILSPRSTRKPRPAPRTATANTGSATSAANASVMPTEKPKSPKPLPLSLCSVTTGTNG